MTSETVLAVAAKGGDFLIEDRSPRDIFTPEDFTEEQIMLAQTARDFMQKDVLPKTAEILKLNYETIRELMKKAGEIGLLAIEVPEAYGGLALGKVTGALASEISAMEGSWAVTFMGHTGIGTLPITYFGTDEQKAKYLPKFGTGEWISSYSLSEASSASDALNAKARAVLSPDGKNWILNGEKMWLTNGGFADVYITFAKVDGEQFTAFIIDKGSPGVSLGPEERKLGIKGSSTRPVILQDAVIPKENLLGEIGKGHKIAFNILNIGRFKLGAGCVGGSTVALKAACEYAKERSAFGKKIADFGLIQSKIGEMTSRIFAAESMAYRTAGMIDANLEGVHDNATSLKRIEEYDAECSMVKVFCSEVLDHVVDESVQILGGAGYVEDYPVERYYRDARINRIFEGTNEINRLLVPGRMVRRALSGALPIFDAAMALLDEPRPEGRPSATDAGFLAAEVRLTKGAKKISLMLLALAAQKFQAKLQDQQEVMGFFADVAIDTYALESALLRTQKKAERDGEATAGPFVAALQVFAEGAVSRIEAAARQALPTIESGDMLATCMEGVARFTDRQPVATIPLRRSLAALTLDKDGYPF
ncbi:MAG: acyl-CoA dehydrogenase family protein [Vicinamibacteria bacterium]|nr:acyl-CoA dehydrogenase family protein [Vicinamibacteria bacterium]